MNTPTILVVDDSKAVHSLTQEILETLNIKVFHAFNGEEALEWYRVMKDGLTMTLLDWEMPIIDGITALPTLKKQRPETPILMMTSKGDMMSIQNALSKGATDYIIKPYTQDILVEKIQLYARSI